MTNTIGTSEHGGRVRGVGRFANLSNYFGRSSRPTQNTIDVKEIEAQLEAKLEEKLSAKIKEEFTEVFEQQLTIAHEKMQQSFMEKLNTMGLSEISKTNKQASQNVVDPGSTKGSCSAAAEIYKEDNVQKVLFMFLKEQQHVYLTLQHDPHYNMILLYKFFGFHQSVLKSCWRVRLGLTVLFYKFGARKYTFIFCLISHDCNIHY